MKKKIIISNYDDLKNPFYGGGGAYAVHKTAAILSKKFEVTVLTGKYKGSVDQQIDGVNYKRIGIALGGGKIGQILYQLILPYYAITEKFDIWIENFTPPFSTALIPFFTKKPVIGLVHMLSAKDMERKYKIPFHLIENFGLKFYKKFIVTQNQTKKEIEHINKSAQISVISNGVDEINIDRRAAKKHILFIGRIEINQKGIDLLLEAYKKSGVSQKLLIAGNGEKKQIKALNELIIKLDLKSQVKVLGRVDRGIKARLFSEAFCVVVPSRFETFSIVSLESLSAGIPLVTFNIPGLKWIPNGYSIKIRAFDVDKLSTAIKDTTTNKNIQRTFSKKGIEYAKKFNWKNVGSEYLKVLAN